MVQANDQLPMQLHCPYCRSAVTATQALSDPDVVCPNCGSAFQLDTDRTLSWTTEELPRLGKFQLIRLAGRGAFGTVYQARDLELNRIVAVKVPRSGRFATREDEERFVREARSTAKLNHPGIASVYEVGHSDAFPYIVAEYVEGITLADIMTAGCLSFQESAQLVAEIADALDHAHQRGVIHRDMKPSNVMLERFDTQEERGADATVAVEHAATENGSSRSSSGSRIQRYRCRLMDFGLARGDEGDISVTVDGQVLGTPAYMSPEQARGDSHLVDPRSDVYGLGTVLYQLLTGEIPFRGSPRMILHQVLFDDPPRPRLLNDQIPRDLEAICLKAVQKEPTRRYQTAAALADDLRRYLNGEEVLARPYSRVARTTLWCRRPERVRDAGAIAVFLSVVLMLWAVWGAVVAVWLGYASHPLQAILHLAAMVVLFYVPMGIVGLATLRYSLTAIWAGLGVGAWGIVFLIAWANQRSLGLDLSFGGVYEDPRTLHPVFALFMVLEFIILAVYCLALFAYYANRNTMRWYQSRQSHPSRASSR